MAILVISSHLGRMYARLPHRIYLNGQLVGVMTTPTVRVSLSPGSYDMVIQSVIPILSASTTVSVHSGLERHLDFSSRERWWDILFSIDLVLCVLKIFLTFPNPWNWIYEVLTNGFFVAWLLYVWIIRKKYYHLTSYETLPA